MRDGIRQTPRRCCTLLALLITRRSAEGHAAVDLVRSGLNQSEAADRLRITKQAMSQRLAAAGWQAEQPARDDRGLLDLLDSGRRGNVNATALLLLAATAVAGPILQHRRVPGWLAPALVAALAGSAAVFAAAGSAVGGFGIGATLTITVLAAALGGLPAAPAAFRIAGRRDLPIIEDDQGPLRGGRIIGVFERTAIAVTDPGRVAGGHRRRAGYQGSGALPGAA